MADLSEGMWNLALQLQQTSYPTTAMPMATKLDRVVTYHERLPSIKIHDLLITWYCEITWQTKTIIIPLPEQSSYSHQTQDVNLL